MSTRSRLVKAPPAQVWDVLADGWTFSLWTVGATSVRDVSPDWPAAGATVRHVSGFWPLTVERTSAVVECAPGSRLRVEMLGVVPGHAELEISLSPSGADTELRFAQRFAAGPLSRLPEHALRRLLRPADEETLTRLAWIAENRR